MKWYGEPLPVQDDLNATWRDDQVYLWAGNWPTVEQIREFNAPGTADTILQIVRRDAAYGGLGAEMARDDHDRPAPARERHSRAYATRQT